MWRGPTLGQAALLVEVKVKVTALPLPSLPDPMRSEHSSASTESAQR